MRTFLMCSMLMALAAAQDPTPAPTPAPTPPPAADGSAAYTVAQVDSVTLTLDAADDSYDTTITLVQDSQYVSSSFLGSIPAGATTITMTAFDSSGNTALYTGTTGSFTNAGDGSTQSISISLLNQKPPASISASAQAPVCTSVIVNPAAVSWDETVTLTVTAVDVDSADSAITYTVDESQFPNNAAGSSDDSQCGASGATCVYEYTAASPDSGEFPVGVTVSDSGSNSYDCGTISFDVLPSSSANIVGTLNDPPFFTDISINRPYMVPSQDGTVQFRTHDDAAASFTVTVAAHPDAASNQASECVSGRLSGDLSGTQSGGGGGTLRTVTITPQSYDPPSHCRLALTLDDSNAPAVVEYVSFRVQPEPSSAAAPVILSVYTDSLQPAANTDVTYVFRAIMDNAPVTGSQAVPTCVSGACSSWTLNAPSSSYDASDEEYTITYVIGHNGQAGTVRFTLTDSDHGEATSYDIAIQDEPSRRRLQDVAGTDAPLLLTFGLALRGNALSLTSVPSLEASGACSAGTRKTATGQCAPCPPGQFQAQAGQSTCIAWGAECAAGEEEVQHPNAAQNRKCKQPRARSTGQYLARLVLSLLVLAIIVLGSAVAHEKLTQKQSASRKV